MGEEGGGEMKISELRVENVGCDGGEIVVV